MSGIQWEYGAEDAVRMLSPIINFNRGAWKSVKQRNFAKTHCLTKADPCYPRNQENAKMYGVDLGENQSGLVIEGVVRWVDYGLKSFRRCAWFYVLDEVGVVAKYKLRFTYSDGGSS